MGIKQRSDLERDDRRHESAQARLAGRLKSACCCQCGSVDGMQSVHRDTLTEMPPPTLNWIRSQKLWWYREPGNDEYLFYPCQCNPDRVIPSRFVATHDIAAWLNTDSVAPDYAALAVEGPVLASQDSHEGAGL